ncbi:MAG: putative glycosyl transferase [Bacteroidota bacterium]|nr:putative glycosyl transferase [Bacteroidota bacterium]
MASISVLMPAYNSEKYIGEAINSLLSQTFSDFELIIINDGSKDNTHQVISDFQDSRIKYFQNTENSGLIFTRNKLIQLAACDYIAFLDSDDLAEPKRLEIEFKALKSNANLAFVSSSFHAINENSEIIKSDWKYNLSPVELPVHFLFYNPIATSSVMIRKSFLPEKIFREGYPVCEDYDLWTRIIQNYDGNVLPEFLTRYRVYDQSICKQQPENIISIRNKIILNQLEMYFPNEYTEEEKIIHLSLVEFSLKNKIDDIGPLTEWIRKLIALNQQHHHFDERILKQLLYERVLKKFLRLDNYDYSVFKTLLQLKKELNPKLTFELRKKEMAIFAFSLAGNKFIKLN